MRFYWVSLILMLCVAQQGWAVEIRDCLKEPILVKSLESTLSYVFSYSETCDLTEPVIDVDGAKLEVELRSDSINMVFSMPIKIYANSIDEKGSESHLPVLDGDRVFRVAQLEIILAPYMNIDVVNKMVNKDVDSWVVGRRLSENISIKTKSTDKDVRIDSDEYPEFFVLCNKSMCTYYGFSSEFGLFYVLTVFMPGDFYSYDWETVRGDIREFISGVVKVRLID